METILWRGTASSGLQRSTGGEVGRPGKSATRPARRDHRVCTLVEHCHPPFHAVAEMSADHACLEAELEHRPDTEVRAEQPSWELAGDLDLQPGLLSRLTP